MKVTIVNGGVTIDWAEGAGQVVMFGGHSAGPWHAIACNGGVGATRDAAAAECPVILWDEVGAAPSLSLAARRS